MEVLRLRLTLRFNCKVLGEGVEGNISQGGVEDNVNWCRGTLYGLWRAVLTGR